MPLPSKGATQAVTLDRMRDLAKLTAALDRATSKTTAARAELHAAILEHLAAGTPQVEIVRQTGYTRETIRRIAAAKRST